MWMKPYGQWWLSHLWIKVCTCHNFLSFVQLHSCDWISHVIGLSSSILSTSWILSFTFIKIRPCGIAHLCLLISSICVKVLWNSIHVVKVLWYWIIDMATTISVVHFYPWKNMLSSIIKFYQLCLTTCVIKFHEHKVIHRWYKIAFVLNLIPQ